MKRIPWERFTRVESLRKPDFCGSQLMAEYSRRATHPQGPLTIALLTFALSGSNAHKWGILGEADL